MCVILIRKMKQFFLFGFGLNSAMAAVLFQSEPIIRGTVLQVTKAAWTSSVNPFRKSPTAGEPSGKGVPQEKVSLGVAGLRMWLRHGLGCEQCQSGAGEAQPLCAPSCLWLPVGLREPGAAGESLFPWYGWRCLEFTGRILW